MGPDSFSSPTASTWTGKPISRSGSINADGSDATQLTNNTFLDTEPAWSPLGDQIAFVATRPGDTNRNIYVMDADGSGQTSITPQQLHRLHGNTSEP